ARMWLCNWKDLDDDCSRLLAELRAGKSVFEPIPLLAISPSRVDQLTCGRLYAAENFATHSPPVFESRGMRDRIRVAYVSPDFREHPVSFLTAGIFEEHDKSRFDILAISLSSDEQSVRRARIKRAVTQFIVVGDRSAAELAAMLRERGVDIAVDLVGYTLGGRVNLFAQRIAPIQVSYLGFPATTGAPFIDYILADRIVIPPHARQDYSEHVVHLP